MFGRHPRLPTDVELDSQDKIFPEADGAQVQLAINAMLQTYQFIAEQAGSNITIAQQEQKDDYDGKHCFST